MFYCLKGGNALDTPGRRYPSRQKLRAWICICALILPIYACQTPLSDYQARIPEEKEIVRILIEFQDAKNNRDMDRLLPLLHPDGEFTYACGIMVSKTDLAAKLPGFWEGLDSQLLGTVPMAHECLNGDYYTKGVLKEPEITISADNAQVKVWFTRRWWSSLLLFATLVKADGRWQILRTWWGPS